MARKITKPLSSIDHLMQEWDWEKNTLNPSILGFQSNQKVWWKCPKCGCEYQAYISNRIKGYGCKCSGKRAQKRKKQVKIRLISTVTPAWHKLKSCKYSAAIF